MTSNFNEIALPTERFVLEKAIDLYTNGLMKDRLDCKNYLMGYVFPIEKGNFLLYRADSKKFIHYESSQLTAEILNRLPKDIGHYVKCSYTTIYNICVDVNKPRVYKGNGFYYVNLSGVFKHKAKPYNTYSNEINNKCDIFFKYIREVLSDNNDDVYDYWIKFIANICHGNRADVIAYNKGPEGIGKSTLTDMICKYIIGNELTTKATGRILTTEYNKLILGKLF
jgi:hypothetical protein